MAVTEQQGSELDMLTRSLALIVEVSSGCWRLLSQLAATTLSQAVGAAETRERPATDYVSLAVAE